MLSSTLSLTSTTLSWLFHKLLKTELKVLNSASPSYLFIKVYESLPFLHPSSVVVNPEIGV